ncbi:hypothetical protein F8O01_06010 [Pseudoclavibacter chungangensis]|uniref:Uncharacterized protein n=1 Tax=Pseudoclavibacter chungangensis TaxID=587635 RepID=A0A7J5BYQ6_9MICO|nr:hypothetical protein [Pseudoclavibacter chungangensis]KAB1659479.1 hypothetical protein F8O01_06010 [Pseudoclavibacter chungangensis]NYJ67664.1 biotin carboxyl carrier protein [Pseudoclavibacter chungangensis]
MAPEPEESISAAQAANGGDFAAGNIISDENFYDGGAMTEQEVYDFLLARVSGGNEYALRNYTQVTPDMPADQYCQAYTGSARDSAAAIIAKVGAACNFSQKAMLVLLEKEQSLVSMSNPTPGRLAAATGFGCPDTAPCDSSVGGFFYQIYYAARQFQVYKANPYSYNHVPFQTNNVLYNPNASCGSSPVYIENYATAGLYNYTPYQPNQAALNNLYGEGDGCSAYGNRNFWWMYTDWFGSTQAEVSQPQLVRAQGTSEVYLVADNTRYYVPAEYFDTISRVGDVRDVAPDVVAAMPEGAHVSPLMVTTAGQPVFLGDDGKYWNVADCEVFADFGGDCDGAARITPQQLESFNGGWTLQPVVSTLDGKLLLIEDGTKREITGRAALAQLDLDGIEPTIVADRRLAYLATGDPIIGAGVVKGDDGQPALVLDASGTGHAIPAELSEFAAFTAMSSLSTPVYESIPVGSALPATALVADATGAYLLTDAGALAVSRAHFGAGAEFATVPDGVPAALTSAGSSLGGTLVRAGADGKISLVYGGERVEFDDQEKAEAEASSRGVPTTVYTTTSTALDSVPVGNGITTGTLIKPQGSSDLYILDGSYLQPIASPELAEALGFGTKAVTITTASFDNLEQRSTTITGTQFECDGTTWFGTGGKRYAFTSEALRTSFGLESQTISPELCGLIPASSTPMGDLVKTSGGAVYWIDGGLKHHILGPGTVEAMGGTGRLIDTSDAVLAQFKDGPDLAEMPAGYEPPTSTTPAPEPTETPAPTPTDTATATPEPTPTATDEPAIPVATGDVITNRAGTGIWLVNGDRLLQIGSAQVAADLGLDVSAPIVAPKANFEEFAGRTAPLYNTAVRCGSTSYIGIGGELVPYESGAVEAAYALDHVALDEAICSTLTISATEKIGLHVQTADGSNYIVENGALRLMESTQETGTPTQDATEEATPDASESPTSTPTPEPTSTDTPAPTASETPEPTATTEPTATSEPTATTEPVPTADGTVILPIEIVSAMGRGEPVAI